jgi:hypothetical protein
MTIRREEATLTTQFGPPIVMIVQSMMGSSLLWTDEAEHDDR